MEPNASLPERSWTPVTIDDGVRIDLFTPTMFRFRLSTLAGDRFPSQCEVPFAMQPLQQWPSVSYRRWTDRFDFVETDLLRIRISRDPGEARQFQVYAKGDGRRIYPADGHGSGAGMFRDGYTVFDSASAFGEENRNSRYAHWFYNPGSGRYDSFLAADAILDTFFVYGPGYKELFSQLNALVGPEPLLPKKAYGFFQTQHLGCAGSQEKLMCLADRLRERHIPCDTLILDFEWGDGCDGGKEKVHWGSRITWSSNYTKPLTPERMIAVLKEKHFDLMIIHHSAPAFPNRTAQGWTCREWDEREWWSELRSKLDSGLAGTWQDTRQNDITDSVIWLGIQEHLGKGRRVLFMGCRDMWETFVGVGKSKLIPNDQIIGSRRYPFDWTGDCDSSWEELRWQIRAITDTHGSMKAVSYVTSDCQTKNYRTQARWNQFLSFNSIARSHTQKPWQAFLPQGPGADLEQETPGENAEASIRKHLLLRYRLLPYLYSYAHLNHRTGLPICRPMLLEFPEDPECNRDQWPYQYMFGAEILVAPVHADVLSMEIYLPAGSGWIDFWDGRTYPGGGVIRYDTTDIERLPLFVRSGAIIPMTEEREWIDPAAPNDPLILEVYPGGTSWFVLYEDDGISLTYQEGSFATTRFECDVKPSGDIGLWIGRSEGTYAGKLLTRTCEIRFHGVPGRPDRVLSNGAPLREHVSAEALRASPSGWVAETPSRLRLKLPIDASQEHLVELLAEP